MNEELAVTLDWEGPLTCRDFIEQVPAVEKYKCTSGVYLCTEQQGATTVLTYVGKAADLWTRQVQHYMNQISGQAIIPKDFCSDGQAWDALYKHDRFRAIVSDVERFRQLVTDAFRYVQHVRVFLCRRPAKEVRVLERNLLYDLQPRDTKWGRETVPSVRIDIRHRNALWVSPEIREHAKKCNLLNGDESS